MTHGTTPVVESGRRIAIATGLALLVAVVILLTVVLPAEYAFDPVGTGQALGLTALAETGPQAVTPQRGEFKMDVAEFVLGRYESVEYTYRIEKDAGVLFSWQATGRILSDFHGQPDGAPADYAESHDRREETQAHGTFIAPFAGIHGWYWENIGEKEVTIRLTSAGFYSLAQEFFDGRLIPHSLKDAAGNTLPEGSAP